MRELIFLVMGMGIMELLRKITNAFGTYFEKKLKILQQNKMLQK